jgi:hypothetical protein
MEIGFRDSGASVASRTYCPGVWTGLFVYLPLAALLIGLALRDGLLGLPAMLAALGLAAAFHTLEVGHNVFARW